MDITFVCKDALESSFIANLVLAMEARKQGVGASVLFTGEALAALAGESLGWPRLLRQRDTIMGIAAKAKDMDIPMVSERDPRETDPWKLMEAAKTAGVSLVACPLWTRLLGLEGKLPAEVAQMDAVALLKQLEECKVVGGF